MRRLKHWLIVLLLVFTSSAPALASTIGLSTRKLSYHAPGDRTRRFMLSPCTCSR
jgi:hypothetical protein